MHISVIVPTHNSSTSLHELLKTLQFTGAVEFDLIVVDDASDLDFQFNELPKIPHQILRLPKRQGPAFARNFGAKHAEGQVLLFIDSDILVYPDTLSLLQGAFERSRCEAVNGMIDSRHPARDFFSNFYNLRLCYNYSRLPERIKTIYSSLFAINRATFLQYGGFAARFDRPTVEDSELGYRLSQQGVGIYLDHSLKFIHNKPMSLVKLLKNDWVKSIAKAELLLSQIGFKEAVVSRELYSTPKSHVLSVPFAFITPAALVASVFNPWLSFLGLASAVVFAFLNFGYLRYFYFEKGFFFAARCYLFLFVDLIVAGIGILVGMAHGMRSKS